MKLQLRRLLVLTFAIVALIGIRTAGFGASPPTQSDAPSNVTIAYQPGIGYANLIVMKEQGTLEKEFPKTHFDWKVLSSGSAIRDGIIAGQIQIGAGGIAPFLIGWDKGVGYRLIGSLNEMNLQLVTRDPKVHSLKDITPNMKIGLPAPDSIQAIALEKGAQMQLGNAHALDSAMVAIAHPLGLQALSTGQLALHLSAPPFQFEEVKNGGHVVFKSYDAFGTSTFNSVFTTDRFANDSPKFVAAFYRALLNATQFVKAHPKETADLLAKDSEGRESAANFQRWITHPDVVYTTVPHGMLSYARFMQSIGLLSKVPASMRDIELSTLGGVGD